MAVLIDIEQITVRKGPTLVKYGDLPVEGIVQGKIEHDRYVHLYAAHGSMTMADFSETNRQLIEMGARYGWRGIRWERFRDGAVCAFAHTWRLRPRDDN